MTNHQEIIFDIEREEKKRLLEEVTAHLQEQRRKSQKSHHNRMEIWAAPLDAVTEARFLEDFRAEPSQGEIAETQLEQHETECISEEGIPGCFEPQASTITGSSEVSAKRAADITASDMSPWYRRNSADAPYPRAIVKAYEALQSGGDPAWAEFLRAVDQQTNHFLEPNHFSEPTAEEIEEAKQDQAEAQYDAEREADSEGNIKRADRLLIISAYFDNCSLEEAMAREHDYTDEQVFVGMRRAMNNPNCDRFWNYDGLEPTDEEIAVARAAQHEQDSIDEDESYWAHRISDEVLSRTDLKPASKYSYDADLGWKLSDAEWERYLQGNYNVEPSAQEIAEAMEDQAEQYASDRAFYNFLSNMSSANLYRDKWDSREITAEEIAYDNAEQRELETEYFHAQPGTWPFDNSGMRFTNEGYQTGDCNVEPSEGEILGAIQDQGERDGADYEDGFVEGHSDLFMQTAEPTDAEIAEQERPGWHQWWSDIFMGGHEVEMQTKQERMQSRAPLLVVKLQT